MREAEFGPFKVVACGHVGKKIAESGDVVIDINSLRIEEEDVGILPAADGILFQHVLCDHSTALDTVIDDIENVFASRGVKHFRKRGLV